MTHSADTDDETFPQGSNVRAAAAAASSYQTTSTVEPHNTNTTSTTSNGKISNANVVGGDDVDVPLYQAQGIFAVHKPINWTSQDVVAYIRGILEREAKGRGAHPVRPTSRRNKSRIVRVGHGGTLDPLATGVLVIGVGKGTKQLNNYLSGSKAYRATGLLGIETSTLDLDPTANVTKEATWDHITKEAIENVIPKFIGKIKQVPPVFSAKKVGGKKLYEAARQGLDVGKIEPKEVEIYQLKLLSCELPYFSIEMECGGGTFVRSLIRDISYELDSVATTATLERIKQGPFLLDQCLSKDNWTADNFYSCIEEWNKKFDDKQ
jgi:tRNA pseudouridine55 synthase